MWVNITFNADMRKTRAILIKKIWGAPPPP
ncbi:hypothetical protein SK44_03548, partial [Klebsiella aerogenes]